MFESPILQELRAECTSKTLRMAILNVLKARFGVTALELERLVKEINEEQLDELLNLAATCRSLASFRKKLAP